MPGDQIPHSVLPPAEMGTAHMSNIMSIKHMITAFTILALFMVVAVITGVQGIHGLGGLDAAVAAQCQQHDWPVQAHQIHMDWCAANSYATN